jgi:hypothetical protein
VQVAEGWQGKELLSVELSDVEVTPGHNTSLTCPVNKGVEFKTEGRQGIELFFIEPSDVDVTPSHDSSLTCKI